MKLNRKFNHFILGALSLLQLIHLGLEYKKDVLIGISGLSQMEIKNRMDLSIIQGDLSYLMPVIIVVMIIFLILNYKNNYFKRLVFEDMLTFIGLWAITYVSVELFGLLKGNSFELLLNSYMIFIILILLYLYLVVSKKQHL